MDKRRRRQKASDVFRETEFVYSSKTDSFDKAFPEIEDVKIEVTESGEGTTQLNCEHIYRKQTFPGEYINCHNPLCYNGGFSIGEIIRNMTESKQAELVIHKICQGYEGSPKGRRRYGRCQNSFDIKVTIEYKEEKNSG